MHLAAVSDAIGSSPRHVSAAQKAAVSVALQSRGGLPWNTNGSQPR
jgi:hypothetical protein